MLNVSIIEVDSWILTRHSKQYIPTWRQSGRVVWAPDLKLGPTLLISWICSRWSRAQLLHPLHVHSQLVCFLSIGIVNLLSLFDFMITLRLFRWSACNKCASTINVTFKSYGIGHKRIKNKVKMRWREALKMIPVLKWPTQPFFCDQLSLFF